MNESAPTPGNGADPESPFTHVQAPASLAETGRRLQGDVQRLAGDLQEAGGEVERFVTVQIRERPYVTLGAAAGVGYLLGGGLGSRLTLLMAGVATRLAMAMAAREMESWAARRPATALRPWDGRLSCPPGEGAAVADTSPPTDKERS